MTELNIEEQSFYDLIMHSETVNNLGKAETAYLVNNYEIPKKSHDLFALLIMALEYRLSNGDACIRLTTDAISSVLDEWQESCSHITDPRQAMELGEICRKGQVFVKKAGRQGLEQFLEALSCVGKDGETYPKLRPLMLSCGRLYFRRYFKYEQRAAKFVSENRELNYYSKHKDFISQALDILFDDADGINLQKVAAAMAALHRFTIISGGPGTGKTTTVAKVLLLLLALNKDISHVYLCAPTGKAAARMTESLSVSLSQSQLQEAARELARLAGSEEDLIGKIKIEAHTIHSLIKVIPHKCRAIFNSDHPLDCDLLIVDEVSMLDLSLFNRLISALKPEAQVVMLGDRDQLNSVEAGSVLGDLCKKIGTISPDTLEKLGALTGYDKSLLAKEKLADEICLLTKSWRFDESSGIGVLSRIINAESFADLNFKREDLKVHVREELERLEKKNTPYQDAKLNLIEKVFTDYGDKLERQLISSLPMELSAEEAGAQIARECVQESTDMVNFADFLSFVAGCRAVEGAGFCLSDDEAVIAFEKLNRFRVLCSNRQGRLGDNKLNEAIAHEVIREYDLEEDREYIAGQEWFPGRVVIITKNDQVLKINNGDVGFAAYEKRDDGSRGPLRLFMPGAHQGEIVKLSPLYIVNHDSGFAMTIHKSQGSEYERVLIVLADKMNAVLTRELIYTAITRAKDQVKLIYAPEVFKEAVNTEAVRESGLAIRILGGSDALGYRQMQ